MSGRELFEPLHDVLPQAGLVVVHENTRRNVHRAYKYEAVGELRFRANALDGIGDVEDVVTLIRLKRFVVRE